MPHSSNIHLSLTPTRGNRPTEGPKKNYRSFVPLHYLTRLINVDFNSDKYAMLITTPKNDIELTNSNHLLQIQVELNDKLIFMNTPIHNEQSVIWKLKVHWESLTSPPPMHVLQ